MNRTLRENAGALPVSDEHIATVIVVHDSGRLYPEAIIFTTTAP